MHKMISSKILEGMKSLYIPVIASTESSTATWACACKHNLPYDEIEILSSGS